MATEYEPKGCLPRIFHGLACWLATAAKPTVPPLETTGWVYEEPYEMDLTSAGLGKISVPPRFTRKFEGGSVTVDRKGKSWSGDEVQVWEDGTIVRSERQRDLERQPDPETEHLLRKFLGDDRN